MVESAMFLLSRLDHLEGKEAEGVVVTKLVKVIIIIIIVMVVEMQVISMLWDHFKDFNVKQIFYLFSLFPSLLSNFDT